MHQQSVCLILVVVSCLIIATESKKLHYIHWNQANPMFRIDNTDHIVDVNTGNEPWEYDQANIICPTSKAGIKYPEKHVIYSVSREEFDSCRITNPKPTIVAICNQPHRLMYFTITFRSFTPTPGGLEFHPGQDYYFISTATPKDLHRRVGGGCSTHNMKMIFRVADNRISTSQIFNDLMAPVEPPTTTTTTTTTERPLVRGINSEAKLNGGYVYYYHPRDLIALEDNSIENNNSNNNRRNNYDRDIDINIWKKEALRYTSGSVNVSSSPMFALCLALLTSLVYTWK